MTMFDQYLAATLVGSICAGLGLMILVAQRAARTNAGAAITFVCAGLAALTNAPLVHTVSRSDPGFAARGQVVFEAVALWGSATYLLGLLDSAQTTPRATRLIGIAVRLAYALAALLVVLGVSFPSQRLDDYELSLGDPGFATRGGFWLFAAFWLVVISVFSTAWIALARQKLDVGEHTRAVCSMVSSPFLVISTALPLRWALCTLSVSMVAVLYGQFRYLVSEGERAAFLSQFLSRQVAERVRVDGLVSVVRPDHVELTVVCCDLRGFTAYSEGVPSQAVIDLLGDYYDAVGVAVAEVDGTIKDYAGDGVLILVGAPIPRSDHAAAGLRLARRIHEVTAPVIERWATGPHPLGVGVGAASGRATVGAIGSAARMEYTAVGVPVNLAARLCSAAAAGETLVDSRLATAAESPDLVRREPLRLKGMGGDVPVFTLAAT
jgi:class 3 adenylate cyclase